MNPDEQPEPQFAPTGTIVDPADYHRVQIPVDKTKYRVRFTGETESYVNIAIEPIKSSE